MSLRETVAKAAEVLDADAEAARAAQEAEEAAKAAANLEEAIREGDSTITPAKLEKAHAESRFARLRREHAERKAARACAEAAERARQEAIDAARAELGPDQLDQLGADYEAAREALAKLVTACETYNQAFLRAYRSLGDAEFGGRGGTGVGGSLSDAPWVSIEGDRYERIHERDVLLLLLERYGDKGKPFAGTLDAVLTRGGGKLTDAEKRNLRHQLGLTS